MVPPRVLIFFGKRKGLFRLLKLLGNGFGFPSRFRNVDTKKKTCNGDCYSWRFACLNMFGICMVLFVGIELR